MEIKTFGLMAQLVSDNIHRIRALGFDVVVHLPRSGTIPASMVATLMAAPFASVGEYMRNEIYTRKSRDFTPPVPRYPLNRILLVDDSLRTGKQMAEAIKKILEVRPHTEIKTLAVFYSNWNVKPGDRVMEPDLYLHKHGEDDDYIFPWFMWKTRRIQRCAVDMDGVLCRDCTREEDDDGENYQSFLQNAEMKYHTNEDIGAIVTGRLEKYRAQTEEWLKRHGFKYQRLIMAPFKDKAERKAYGAAKWKGETYRNLQQTMFVESSAREAPIIHEASGKSVFCIENQEVLV